MNDLAPVSWEGPSFGNGPLNVGAVFDSLKCADIPNFRLRIPPLVEQRAIADILGTLDDKIELNRRMNETLEAMARALFKNWFVDFDPVRAKAAGRQPAGLDAATAALFPDRFENSPFGKIPLNQAYSCRRGGFPRAIHRHNTHATPTIACDGQRVLATFFHHETVQATALSLDGQQIWQKTVGPFNPKSYEYGYAPSPILYLDTVIIVAEYDGDSFLAALDRQTGEQVWRVKRPGNISFSSPQVAHMAGKDQLLISGFAKVASYDPHGGKELWSASGTTAATCGTVVWEGDIVMASGGYPKAETVAVRADGSGEVIWRNGQKCYEQSMLAQDGYVYALTNAGVMYCWRVADGKEMWKQRLKGPVSASAVLAGGNIYWANERGTMYVFKPNPQEFELVAENKLGDDSYPSPAVSGGQLFLRVGVDESDSRKEYLYCIGQ